MCMYCGEFRIYWKGELEVLGTVGAAEVNPNFIFSLIFTPALSRKFASAVNRWSAVRIIWNFVERRQIINTIINDICELN